MNAFDYIIVGAGSAGCVLANRLSASGKDRVLLLEAGGSDRSPLIQVPLGYGLTFADPTYNWMYTTQPDPALNQRASFWPRGKVLGGSSSLNAMVYIRGQQGDYDDWAAAGNTGWAWKDVLPYFKKHEDHIFGASDHHGAGGELRVSDFKDQVHPLCERFLQAGKNLGYARTEDFNGELKEGFGLWQMTIRGGVRESSSNAFLRPALKRSNLTLKTRAHATRVLLENKKAVGVECLVNGALQTFTAAKEVILSGGAINSPQLLQLSGIGDSEHLARVGVPLVLHAPRVGQGLQDHLCVSYFFKSRVPTLNDKLYPWYGKLWAGVRYLFTRKGPLGMSVNQAGAFVRSRPGLERPNLHLYFNPISYSAATIVPGRFKITNPDPFSAFLISFNTCVPTSRGSVTITSSNPLDKPKIETHFLTTEHDLRDIVEGSRMVRSIANSKPLCDVLQSEHLPGVSVQSDADILKDFRARAGSVYHASCTCAMGVDPAASVVDARLRVHGIASLRVVDASVFPSVTSGNTNGPVMMVAEKASEMILQDNA
ncbi:choline dehydrogenase [Rhodoferax lacus]|uniref:Choline dehydrogenase n=1 Tax=Rhodoferax lacus TaxID=2184758 RepID=A0A3E1RGI8_9BURK|nr:GMC family oxidoreductase N-terminal domain-containing protein [Rhodoferax lacus]RFO98373.1 choline dehydrogenase [Rhodoferax lacus]